MDVLIQAVAVLAEVDLPDIKPDFSAPWMSGLQTVVSWILGTAIVLVFGALIFAVAALAFRAVPEQARSWAGDNLIRLIIAIIVLGSIGALYQYFINFNFGF